MNTTILATPASPSVFGKSILKWLSLLVAVLLSAGTNVSAADMDKTAGLLAEAVKQAATQANIKSVTILDMRDFEGALPELGRVLATDVTLKLANSSPGFSVIDRGDLQKLMDEHELTSTGLVDPETARKLGKIIGVEALGVGTITELDNSFRVTIKLINTETAKVIGGASVALDATIETRGLYRRLIDGTERGGKAKGNRFQSQRLGQFKITPVRVRWLEESARYVVDLEVLNESTETALFFAGTPSANKVFPGLQPPNVQRLSASFETDSGQELQFLGTVGLEALNSKTRGRRFYAGEQLGFCLGARQPATFSVYLKSKKRLYGDLAGTLSVAARAAGLARGGADIFRRLQFADLRPEEGV